MTNPNAHPNGELENLIDQQRTDTVDWQRNQNLSPQGDSPVVAEVHVSDLNEEISDLGQVVLSSSSHRVTGSVLASTADEFWVNWEDGNQTIEKKANYTLVATNCGCGTPGCNGSHGVKSADPTVVDANPSTGTNPFGQVGPAGGTKI